MSFDDQATERVAEAISTGGPWYTLNEAMKDLWRGTARTAIDAFLNAASGTPTGREARVYGVDEIEAGHRVWDQEADSGFGGFRTITRVERADDDVLLWDGDLLWMHCDSRCRVLAAAPSIPTDGGER